MTIDQGRRVSAFWKWFSTVYRDIENAYSIGDVRWLNSQFTERIHAIEPSLNWEIGPYCDPDFALVISPSIRENIGLAKTVVGAAPAVAGWHILAAKPPKKMTSLSIRLPLQPEIEVCADGWSYRLTSYNNGEFFDVEVFTDAPDSIQTNNLIVLTQRLIEALVGELTYLERFEAVTVYRSSDPRSPENTTPLRLLDEHLASLLGKSHNKT